MRRVKENPSVVEDYIGAEVLHDNLLGPHARNALPFPSVQCSPLGIIPRDTSHRKCRLIVDLSSPRGANVSNGIKAEYCSFEIFKS